MKNDDILNAFYFYFFKSSRTLNIFYSTEGKRTTAGKVQNKLQDCGSSNKSWYSRFILIYQFLKDHHHPVPAFVLLFNSMSKKHCASCPNCHLHRCPNADEYSAGSGAGENSGTLDAGEDSDDSSAHEDSDGSNAPEKSGASVAGECYGGSGDGEKNGESHAVV